MSFYVKVHKFLKKIYAGTDMSFLDMDKYIDALRKDKKNEDGHLGLILTSGYGHMFKKMVPCDDNFREIIEDYMKGEYE
jgi:3-dehydroquinate synthetase